MAAQISLTVAQGTTWQADFTYLDEDGTPVSLTGCSARAQVRRRTVDDEPLVTFAGDSLEIDAPAGRVSLRASAADTADWTWRSARYDLELVYPDGRVLRLAEGQITVNPEVTR